MLANIKSSLVEAIVAIYKHLAGQHDQLRHAGIKKDSYVVRGMARLSPTDVDFLTFLVKNPNMSTSETAEGTYISESGYDRNMRHLKRRLGGAKTKASALFLGTALGFVDTSSLQRPDFDESLTDSEREIVGMLAGGLTYSQIADELGKRRHESVAASIENMMGKLGSNSAEELVLSAVASNQISQKEILKRFYPDHYEVIFGDHDLTELFKEEDLSE